MKITHLSIEILFGAPTGPLLLSSRNQQIFGLDPQTIILRGRYHLPRTVGGVKHHLKWSRNLFFQENTWDIYEMPAIAQRNYRNYHPSCNVFAQKFKLASAIMIAPSPILGDQNQRCCEQCGRQVSKQRTSSSTSLCRCAPGLKEWLPSKINCWSNKPIW